MNFSLRTYHFVLIAERFFVLCCSIGISIIAKPFVQVTLPGMGIFSSRENVWWNLNWLNASPWGSLLGYVIIAGVAYATVFFVIGVLQNVVRFFLERELPFFTWGTPGRRNKNTSRAFVAKHFSWRFYYLLLHPYRRLAWIVIPLHKERNLQQFVVEQREKRLSEIDNRHIEGFWTTVKAIAWFSILAAWFLSLWRFYQYVAPIIAGSGNLNSIGLYFSSSFRIFAHAVIVVLMAVIVGAVARKLWMLHLFHLDEAIFDEIICKIEKEKDQWDGMLKTIKEAFVRLDLRISNLERLLLQKKNANAK